MSTAGLDDPVDHGDVHAALDLARLAPSVHNSQPWWWRTGDGVVHLCADLTRWLPGTDPDGRDLLLACGAALHHLRIALAARGHGAVVHRLPEPDEPDLLAVLGIRPGPRPEPAVDPTLVDAIPRRHTDRRPYRDLPLAGGTVGRLTRVAMEQGAQLRVVDDPRTHDVVASALRASAIEHAASEGYRSELAGWTGRPSGLDGVAGHRRTGVGEEPDGATLLLLATSSDDRLSRLRAGEAMSAVLLEATRSGLATCPLSEPMEVDGTRALLEDEVLRGSACPQLLLRVGEAPLTGAAPEASPRRPLALQVEPLGG
ncbi:NAD(P)H nitroreductase [Pseudonocardia xishanensis]|uniref:Nitroreductase family protein n=1 Tax=Pseudonocardia xishanensis TaxID=630995 RepID=A0ABP8RTW2_9PSEU